MFDIKNVKPQTMLIVAVVSFVIVGIGIYLLLKSKDKKSVTTNPSVTTKPSVTTNPTTKSIFKDLQPPFGKYYIHSSNPPNNSVITVSATKVVFESIYNNEYTFKELTVPPLSTKDKGIINGKNYDGTYNFAPVNIGSYKLYVNIVYAPNIPGYEIPYVNIGYSNASNDMYVSSFDSAKGVNEKPAGFIQPLPPSGR